MRDQDKMKAIEMASCKQCGDLEEFKTDGLGINYFQAIGECPFCGNPTFYKNGQPTKIAVNLKISMNQ